MDYYGCKQCSVLHFSDEPVYVEHLKHKRTEVDSVSKEVVQLFRIQQQNPKQSC